MANSRGNQPILCPHGILGKRKCRVCRLEWEREWKKRGDNAEKGRRATRNWRNKNADLCRKKQREALGIPHHNGETREGPCAICKRVRKLVPDHDHESGKMRDWICAGCNLRLGIFESTLFHEFQKYVFHHRRFHDTEQS